MPCTTPTRTGRRDSPGSSRGCRLSQSRGTPSKRRESLGGDDSDDVLISPSKRNRLIRTAPGARTRQLTDDFRPVKLTTKHGDTDHEDKTFPVRGAVCLFPDGKGETKEQCDNMGKSADVAGSDDSDDLSTKLDAQAWLKTPEKNRVGRVPGTPSSAACSPSVRAAYSIVRKCTGSLGGNGSGGAIYGELTTGSMQKVVDLMIKHCDLNSDSRFIDVGAGLGKPNIHVAQNPGVAVSYGIEHEHVRWQLSLHNLKHLLQAAAAQEEADGEDGDGTTNSEKIRHSIFFGYGDIKEAWTLDPFTHVYMFDIGFPPELFYEIAARFNRSRSPWLTCFHGPRLIIERYGFHVELLAQTPTSMHGSSEGHTAYCYRRRPGPRGQSSESRSSLCYSDPAFDQGLGLIERGDIQELHGWVTEKLETHMTSPRPIRRCRSARKLYKP